MGVPPHAFTSAPSRAIENTISISIKRVASVRAMARRAIRRFGRQPHSGTSKSGFRSFTPYARYACCDGCLVGGGTRRMPRTPGARPRALGTKPF